MVFGFFSKKCLGIDIGSFSVKIVEISLSGKKGKLENYLEFKLPGPSSSLRTFSSDNLLLLSDKVSDIILALLDKAKIKEKDVAFSIPDFSTFFTVFNLPPMSDEEVARAVEFEARHYIPLPINEVTIDWQVIEKGGISLGARTKILLVAVPKKVLANYQRVATLSGLRLKNIEAEIFGLIRSSIPEEKSREPVCLVDFGHESTTVSIVENKTLKLSHSYDISGGKLTNALSRGLGVDYNKAEELKIKYGLDPKNKNIYKILDSQIKPLYLEINKICRQFYQDEGRKINNVIFSGGSSVMLGLENYLASGIEKNILIANPFSSVSFPKGLEERLKQIGPVFAIALGAALRELES